MVAELNGFNFIREWYLDKHSRVNTSYSYYFWGDVNNM